MLFHDEGDIFGIARCGNLPYSMMWRSNLIVCCVVLIALATWSTPVFGKPSADDDALRKKLKTMHEKVRHEILSGKLSYMTINRLRMQTNLMEKSGDKTLVEMAKQIRNGHVDYPQLHSYLEGHGPRYLNTVYSTLLRSFEVLVEAYDV